MAPMGGSGGRSGPVKVAKALGAAVPIALLLLLSVALAFVAVLWLLGRLPDINLPS